MTSTSRFSPPRYRPRPAPEWATYIEDRRPRWKVHAGSRGQAINAVCYCYGRGARGGTIYRLVAGEWVEYAVVPKGTPRDEKSLFIPPLDNHGG